MASTHTNPTTDNRDKGLIKDPPKDPPDHTEQAERGAIRKSPQAHKHFCPLLTTAMAFVSHGLVLVQVQVPDHTAQQKATRPCPVAENLLVWPLTKLW